MAQGNLEHANITVSDLDRTADWMGTVFGWKIRWRGDAINGGETVHIGTENAYLAIYTPPTKTDPFVESYTVAGGLNHIGVVVDDLEKAEDRVRQAGFEPHSHADYEPGRRFYFRDGDGIEFELVSYSG